MSGGIFYLINKTTESQGSQASGKAVSRAHIGSIALNLSLSRVQVSLC